jgi:hypothetical protein
VHRGVFEPQQEQRLGYEALAGQSKSKQILD